MVNQDVPSVVNSAIHVPKVTSNYPIYSYQFYSQGRTKGVWNWTRFACRSIMDNRLMTTHLGRKWSSHYSSKLLAIISPDVQRSTRVCHRNNEKFRAVFKFSNIQISPFKIKKFSPALAECCWIKNADTLVAGESGMPSPPAPSPPRLYLQTFICYLWGVIATSEEREWKASVYTYVVVVHNLAWFLALMTAEFCVSRAL